MKTCFYGGTIRTMLPDQTTVEAILVEENVILETGSADDLVPKCDQKIDLAGRTLLPGFNDSHMHLLGFGSALTTLQLDQVRSLDALYSEVGHAVSAVPAGAWLQGRGWNQDYFELPALPCAQELDRVTGSVPTVLRRACGHILVCNSAAMEAAGVTASTNIPAGGTMDRNDAGIPTGIFRENAMDLILHAIPDPTDAEMEQAIEAGGHYLLSQGVTSVQTDDLCVYPIHMTKRILSVLETMAAEGTLPVRVYEQALFRTADNLQAAIDSGWKTGKGDAWFKMGPLKILGDGSLGARTAWLTAPYTDQPDTRGISMYSDHDLTALALLAQENGFSLAIHAIGDAMIDQALSAIETAQQRYPNPSLRHSIVHCQITRVDQLNRMRDLQVLAHIQPIFLHYDLHVAQKRLGADRTDTSYAFETMRKMGIPIAIGTDAPVEPPNTMPNLHCAVTRQDLSGSPKDGWYSHEALSPENALYAMTAGAAWASGEEDLKGTLTAGQLADLVILDKDPVACSPDEILTISVEETWVDGKQVYART